MMRLILLGTAAGGGVPQWNCDCTVCRTVRTDPAKARPRSQCSAAISGDGRSWFLLNASPDVRTQLHASARLWPAGSVRSSPIAGVFLTDADLDHALGLFVLREGKPVSVYATNGIREALSGGLGVDRVLRHYCGIEWHDVGGEQAILRDSAGAPVGLEYAAFLLGGGPPRYHRTGGTARGAVVGYRFVDSASGGSLVYMPHLPELTESALRQLRECEVLLIDGTFWSEDEMRTAGAGTATASDMGHLPVGGPDGSLAKIRDLPIRQKVYIHINNTNPMLLEDSPQRRLVESSGVVVGCDGMELVVEEAPV